MNKHIYAFLGIILIMAVLTGSYFINQILQDIHNVTSGLTIGDYMRIIDIIEVNQKVQLNESTKNYTFVTGNFTDNRTSSAVTSSTKYFIPYPEPKNSDECALNKYVEQMQLDFNNKLRQQFPECYR
jgi:hypothetical protein